MAKAKFYGTGRRKKSIARVYLVPGTGNITVNKRSIDEYFGLETLTQRSRNVWPRGERMLSFPVLLIPVFLPYFGKPVYVGFRHLPEHEPHPQDHIPESGSGSPAH